MLESGLLILFIALVLDWYWGEPGFLWRRLPHPVVMFGKAVSALDRRFNRGDDDDDEQYRKGAMSIAALIALAFFLGSILSFFFELLGPFGAVLEVLMVFTLLAQKSLHEHVRAVERGLREDGLEGGRRAVGMIVGRNPETLDEGGISRAAIESLAENFSDGVVAPAFWYAIFGLPGIFVYKMINTADSMVGYRNEKYRWFGRVSAQIDDLANWVPARISALLISIGAGMMGGTTAFRNAIGCAQRDAGLHRSPNAGWPEAAMAGGMGIALGGPRNYDGELVSQAHINASGKRLIGAGEIDQALDVFILSCFALWAIVALIWVIF